MSDIARETNYYQTIESVSTEGLDELFQEGLLEASSETVEGVLVESQGIPVEIAAQYLGMSTSGILKRLRKGSLAGFKVPSKRGEKWLVRHEAISQGVLNSAKDSLVVGEGVLDHPEESSGVALDLTKESSEEPSLDQALLDDLRRRNIDLEAKLQAASWRNGYLESKLEDRENQIKLLTDSQHKPGWWAKFSSWFFKGQ
ncbi:MAG: hypothetical protein C0508_01595 [Cyanobacteria bacterium PR.023]|nr:hypothetical protein [Cyanobacteria bacterium DS2.008]MBA4073703.1 hypothetical protein [Cyanobacteria bacterium PR.023]